MENKPLKQYIQQKLADLEKGKNLNEVIGKGKLSFGVSSKEFGYLPSWAELIKKKKKLVKLVWIGSFISSFCIVGMVYSFDNNFNGSWPKIIVNWVASSLFIMFFYVLWSYYSLFLHFRQTEREIRKLIYEDILHQLEKQAHLI